MGFLRDLAGVAAPIIGTALGGPVGGAIGAAVGGAIQAGGAGSTSSSASLEAARLQQEEARRQAESITKAGQHATARFDPFSLVGQQGVDQAAFLTDPAQRESFLKNNSIFNLGLQNLNQQTQQGAASIGRLSSGDTLQQLTQNAAIAGAPLLQARDQNIFNLLGIGQNVAGQQGNIDTRTSAQVANLLTGGSAAQAAGVVGSANAEISKQGNLFDIASTLAGNPAVQDSVGDLLGGLFGQASPTPKIRNPNSVVNFPPQ